MAYHFHSTPQEYSERTILFSLKDPQLAQAAVPIQRAHIDQALAICTTGLGHAPEIHAGMSTSVTGAVGITQGVTAILFPRPERATGTETKTKGTLSPVPPVNTSKEQMAPLPIPANVYEDHSLRYITIDNAIQGILRHGRGCFLAKTDIESAFRLIPLKPSDYELFGMFWDGKYYYDKVLPFGLRSAAFLFNMLMLSSGFF